MPAHPERSQLTRGRPDGPARLLITAGPTHEPIDAVRYLGNRSSGRLGIALADAAARGHPHPWHVTLLLGPTTAPTPTWTDSDVTVRRFLTTADLHALLSEEAPRCDVLIMAAAVADYRPRRSPDAAPLEQTKLKRTEGSLSLELESTPDLLAAAAADKRPGQVFIGFALEPAARLMTSAADKLRRKRLDLIVANPLETMDSPLIEATVLGPDGVVHSTKPPVEKPLFARTLLDLASRRLWHAGNAGGAA